MTNFKLKVTGTKSFDNSQVTMGGVDVNEIAEKIEDHILRQIYKDVFPLTLDKDYSYLKEE